MNKQAKSSGFMKFLVIYLIIGLIVAGFGIGYNSCTKGIEIGRGYFNGNSHSNTFTDFIGQIVGFPLYFFMFHSILCGGLG